MKLTINDKTYEISKIPLGKYPELLAKIKGMPKKLMNTEGLNNETFFELLPTLVQEYLPEVIDIVTVATPIPKEEVENMGLYELVDVVVTIIEVNKFIETYQRIKKVTNRPVAQ
jgi:hypothetical protein